MLSKWQHLYTRGKPACLGDTQILQKHKKQRGRNPYILREGGSDPNQPSEDGNVLHGYEIPVVVVVLWVGEGK